jgi:serine/threonine-protein kinase
VSSTRTAIDTGVDIGEIFLEKYRVDAILGHGGMGVVARCTHLALNEQVAIKMLRRDVLDDAEAVERFMREAQAAVKLKSEFVARVTDVGRSETDVPYMVMEYLEGHDLGQLLEQRGAIGIPWAVELTLQACEALCEAHAIGIVHRDIKPTNLFVTWRPDGSSVIKVLDFGISKSPIISEILLTQTQSLLGTPAYMSPEQMRSAHQVDGRTDIWSLGTVLYELIEGRRPFEAASFSEMCVKVAVDPPGAMTTAPPGLQQVVLRCLAKPPEQRYASMAELGADLVPFSQDPHQAKVLVERMSRMLRRSQAIEWDPVRNSMPMLARSAERKAEARSAERKAPSPAASDPALVLARLSGKVAEPSPASSDPALARVSGKAAEPSPASSDPALARVSGKAAAPSLASSDPALARVSGKAAAPSLASSDPALARVSGAGPRVSGAASVPRVGDGAVAAPGLGPQPWRAWRRALLVVVAVLCAATVGGVVSLARDPDPAEPDHASRGPAARPIEQPSAAKPVAGVTEPAAPAGPPADEPAPVLHPAPRTGDPQPAVPAQGASAIGSPIEPPDRGSGAVAAPIDARRAPSGLAGNPGAPPSGPAGNPGVPPSGLAGNPGAPPAHNRTGKPTGATGKPAAPHDDHAARPQPACDVYAEPHAANACKPGNRNRDR